MHLNLDYDMDNDILSVTFIHGVTDPNYHYVSNVRISNNHTPTPIDKDYTFQPSKNIWTYTYDFSTFPAVKHDILEIVATCSLDGAIVKELHVGVYHWEGKGSFSSVIAPTIGGTVIVFAIIAIPWLNKKIRKRK